MNKCLVTKLQGVVNDNTLLKIGEMRFHVKAIDNSQIVSRTIVIGNDSEKEIKARVLDNTGYFINDNGDNIGTEFQGQVIKVPNIDFDFAVSSKYDFDYINGDTANFRNISFDISQLGYLPTSFRLFIFDRANLYGSIDSVNWSDTKIESLDIEGNTNVTGDINSLNSCYSSINGNHILGLGSTALTGNFETFKIPTNTQNITLFDTMVKGKIEPCLEELLTRKSSGMLRITTSSYMSLNNNLLSNEILYITFTGNTISISRNENGEPAIATYNKDSNTWSYNLG